MKRIYLVLVVALGTALFTLNSCKKESNTNNETDLTTEVSTQSDDHSLFNSADDAVSDDINTTLEADPLLGGKTDSVSSCNATIVRDMTGVLKNTITITYNGDNCQGTRTRTGVVVLSLPKNKQWKDVGAQMTVSVQNLKIVRKADGKSLTINGIKTITNVSGHLLRELINGGVSSIVHTVTSSNMSVVFDNGTNRQWQISKQRTFTYSGGFVISVTGTGSVNGATNVAEWGTNRLGQDFSTQIITPLVVRQDCDFRLVSGQVQHTKLTRPITVTFGLDATGNATGCPGAGTYYFKAEWTSVLGVAHSIIKPY